MATRTHSRSNYGLTVREQEVLALAMKGLTRPEIARRHGVETSTVCAQMKSIYRKMGVHNRAEAVAKGLKRGLVEAPVAAGPVPAGRWRGQEGRNGLPPGNAAVVCPHCGGGWHLLPALTGRAD